MIEPRPRQITAGAYIVNTYTLARLISNSVCLAIQYPTYLVRFARFTINQVPQESQGLLQICGVGYRKALEFLIKDYLIATKSSDPNKIKSMALGTCIENYVTEGNVKAVAERAVWLGNDETHYERKWVGKDLADLKTMIDLVVHWITVEYPTKSALESMPRT